MSKRHEPPVETPDDEEKIRVPMRLTELERHRLKILAVKMQRPMEYLAGEWVAERLASEEKKHK